MKWRCPQNTLGYALAWLLWPVGLQAAEVRNLFEVSLPVTDQSQDSRRAAFEQGFAEVLVRVSGNNQIKGINLKQASAQVQQYRYLLLEKPANVAAPKKGELQPTHNLWMQFDDAAIKKLLRNHGLAVWGGQRPEVMIWLAVRDGAAVRYLLQNQDVSPIRDAAMKEAARRGVPLIWPNLEQGEAKKINFADVWAGKFEQLEVIRKSQDAHAILVGRMEWQPKNGWKLDWSYLVDDQQQHWQSRNTDLAALMASGINPVADQLSSRFAIVENPAGVVVLNLQVNVVSDAESYARLTRYLQSLVLVKQFHATDIMPGQVLFQLHINGSADDLRRSIALEQVLLPDAEIVTQQLENKIPAAPDAAATTTATTPAIVLLKYKLN